MYLKKLNSTKTFGKYYIWVTSIILFGLITGCLSKSPRNNHKILVGIKGAIDTSLIKAGSGVSITMTKKKMRNPL